MQFEATPEQAMVRDLAREFATREVRPQARRHDREATWPGTLVKRLGELGLLGVALPESSGGSGADHVSYALAVEEVSAACASLGVIMSVNNSLVCDPLERYATPAQRDAFLRPLARGDMLGCFGLTEPASGSDATQMNTTAHKSGDGWILSGSKNFITNAPHADLVIVFASTEASTGVKGSTAFIVPRTTSGYEIAPHDEKLGIRAAHSSSIHFDECVVSDSQRLGEIGGGVKIALSTLDGGRIGIAAQALGIARAAFEEAVVYARERKAFGEPIAKKQAIQFMLADMATELDAARQLVLRAAWLKDQKRKYTRESAMAKLYAAEMSHRVCHKALQVFGGYGYTTDFDVERHYRDARITEIYEGTSEIMRVVIGSAVTKG
jgi:butyryl-CoA dehydrogenase